MIDAAKQVAKEAILSHLDEGIAWEWAAEDYFYENRSDIGDAGAFFAAVEEAVFNMMVNIRHKAVTQ